MRLYHDLKQPLLTFASVIQNIGLPKYFDPTLKKIENAHQLIIANRH